MLPTATFSAPAFEPDYETLHVTTLLPARTLEHPDYQVATEVVNRGLMNHYWIASRYGPMEAHSDLQLQQRLQEIHALGQLHRMNEGVLVAKSVSDTVWRTAQSVVRAVRDPAGTAEGVHQGIQRLLRRSGRKLQNAYDDVKTALGNQNAESAGSENEGGLSRKTAQAGRTFVRNRLGINRAFRQLARKGGVDPYTDNDILWQTLDYLAKHAAGASLGTSLLMPRIPGLIGTVDNVSRLVWDKDRLDLLLYNEDLLKKQSVPGRVLERFLDNDSYSPTQQTAIVAAIANMNVVSNVWRLANLAAGAEGSSEAAFYSSMIGLLSLYHSNRSAFISIQSIDAITAVAFTRDGRAVIAFPVDRFRWTRETANLVSLMNASPAREIRQREFWIAGEFSDTANRELVSRGWVPFTRAHHRLACAGPGQRTSSTTCRIPAVRGNDTLIPPFGAARSTVYSP